jgi:hypothetical protein
MDVPKESSSTVPDHHTINDTTSSQTFQEAYAAYYAASRTISLASPKPAEQPTTASYLVNLTLEMTALMETADYKHSLLQTHIDRDMCISNDWGAQPVVGMRNYLALRREQRYPDWVPGNHFRSVSIHVEDKVARLFFTTQLRRMPWDGQEHVKREAVLVFTWNLKRRGWVMVAIHSMLGAGCIV